ncbi:tetratricopeptide repeat protein [Streptomyces sp. NPDC001980]|uniref:ATP-binding protein n=1 Tax=Streptomyces sp. NPDC001980 TaxID=3157126 RepID=UPI00331FBCF6
MGGIGKTALAIEAAHRAGAQGWFPGGTLFVDLRGYDETLPPVPADQAVTALLDALGVRGVELPKTADRQHDLFRALLDLRAANGERTLLILDNASHPSQYLPLIPGAHHHRVLITSRDRPDSLPVRVIPLGTLSPEDSAALIASALHSTAPDDNRPAREPEAVLELSTLCGHLPLALQIAAAMLRRRRQRDIASLVAEIKRTGNTSGVLDRSRLGTDLYGRALALRPVLETSYRRLSRDQARLLRLLAMAPGPEVATETAAVLADLASDDALTLLEELAAAHLVTPIRRAGEAGSAMRWRLHDLVREFGAALMAGSAELVDEGAAARERTLAYYLRRATAADDWLRWLPGWEVPAEFADREAALAWLDAERAGLVAAVGWARDERFRRAAVDLALSLGEYLEWRRAFEDDVTLFKVAEEAAVQDGDVRSEADILDRLGIALRELGRAEEAVQAHTRVLGLIDGMADRLGEAMAWGNLGCALLAAGRSEDAVEAHTRACSMFKDVGDGRLQGMAWSNLGLALQELGRVQEAVDAHFRAGAAFTAAGDRHGWARAWRHLGLTLLKADRSDEAIAVFDESQAIHREFNDWYRVGLTLTNLAFAHTTCQNLADARDAYSQAADAYTRANAPTEAAQARTRAAELA